MLAEQAASLLQANGWAVDQATCLPRATKVLGEEQPMLDHKWCIHGETLVPCRHAP